MIRLENSLENLGFSEKKAQIYLAILELAEASVIEIAKKTGLKRTTVYNILPELISEGYIKTGVNKKKKFFFVENPESLRHQKEEELKTIEKLLPELRAIHNIIPYKPKVTFYEGIGGMKELYQDTLDSLSAGDTLLSYIGMTDFYNYMPKEYEDYYVADRVRRKVKLRMIAPWSKEAQAWKDGAVENLREVKIVNNPDFKFRADTEIYADKVALISFRENFLGVIIQSKEISEMHRIAFEIMWNSIPNQSAVSKSRLV